MEEKNHESRGARYELGTRFPGFGPGSALRLGGNARMQSRILTLATFGLLLATGLCPVTAQNAGTSPVYATRPGPNSISIFEKFTTILKHNARIKQVLDFDADVIQIDPIQGSPNQVTVYALKTGITTITLIDEFEHFTKIEVLVRGDVRHLESYLRKFYPNDAIQVEEIKGSILLSGWVTKPEHINEIVAIAEQFYPNVLNHMRIGGVQQVMLKATVMEVNRSKLRQFGMNFGLIGSDSFLLSTPGPITPVEGLGVTNAGANVTFSGFSNTSVSFGFMNPSEIFQGFIDALRTEGLLKIHATPMVVTHNGQPAELLNGGEAPVLVPAGLGTTAIEFKPFGIILNAVPHILGNGRLRLQIEPSVVERDFANAVVVSGITVPSFTVRKVSTQVEMNFGETLVIGGLVSKREDGSTAKLPFFGELPWIGAAFRRTQYTEAETELVILVTPEYVAPMSPDQVPVGGPGKFTTTPTDSELFIKGMLEVPRLGSDCDSVFNCRECQRNGFCHRHPNGRWGLGPGNARGNSGCTDCAPTERTLISPGVQNSRVEERQEYEVIQPINPQAAEELPETQAESELPAIKSSATTQKKTRFTPSRPGRATMKQTSASSAGRSGLLAPLLR